MNGFSRIATTYSGTQAGLIIAVLESCDIDVLTRNFHSTTTLTNYAHATGGIDICVPTADAEDAIDILLNSEPFNTGEIRPWVIPILIFGFLWAGVPPPGTGVIMQRDQNEIVFG